MITGKILEAIEPLVIGIATKKHEPHLTLEEYCDLTIGMEPQNVAEINVFVSNRKQLIIIKKEIIICSYSLP